jgi:hypothetical protein
LEERLHLSLYRSNSAAPEFDSGENKKVLKTKSRNHPKKIDEKLKLNIKGYRKLRLEMSRHNFFLRISTLSLRRDGKKTIFDSLFIRNLTKSLSAVKRA